jgi:hypothetical protein
MNQAFEPALVEYTQAYENSLHFSPRFREYARLLAERLVARYNLRNKDIISIGSGKGEFLSLLCRLGNNRGVGFDPSYVEQEKPLVVEHQAKFVKDFYSERYAAYPADLIESRQMLEHVYDPKGFLTRLRRIMGDRLNTQVFFEVPNALHTFRRLFVWDILYEHFSYFTPASLDLVFSSSGFRVCELTEEFEGQYLCAYAQPDTQSAPHPVHKPTSEVSTIEHDIESFAANYRDKNEKYELELEQMKEEGRRTVVWGAGSKGVTFLNTFKDSGVEYAVDINTRKQGMYVAGTGQRIVPPEFLKDYHPDLIIVMNPIYRKEIQQSMKTLGLSTRTISDDFSKTGVY